MELMDLTLLHASKATSKGAAMGVFELGKIYNLELVKVTQNPDQPRKVFADDEILVLAESIKEKGLLQPILVKELDNGQLIIVSGERRFRAHQLLNKETIPSWFTTGDPEELALVENLVREDLTAIETAEALKRLAEKLEDKSQSNIAKLIGKAESTVSEIMSLNKLPEDIREKARGDKRLALRELKKIASKRKPEKQNELFESYLAKLESKPSRTRSNGTDLHLKKLKSMHEYLMKLNDEEKLEELPSLQDELVRLKDTIDCLVNKISQIT